MNKYGQYCPVARASELLVDRWTLLIVRDLLLGVQRFNALERGLPGISRALLTERLRRLQQAGVLERLGDGRRTSYQLTSAGRDLWPVIAALLEWGSAWAFGEPTPEELDPELLLWWMRDRVHRERLPQDRVVVEFDFRLPQAQHYWLVLQQDDVSVCHTHPGFTIDVFVAADLATFYQIWLGRIAFSDAVAAGQIEIESAPRLTREFHTWFAWSAAAPAVRAAVQRQSA